MAPKPPVNRSSSCSSLIGRGSIVFSSRRAKLHTVHTSGSVLEAIAARARTLSLILPTHSLCTLALQNGVYLQLRGMLQERMGQFFEAVLDYTAALPLLTASGNVFADCLFNRGYCYRWAWERALATSCVFCLLQLWGMLQERMGQMFEAVLD